MYLGHSLFTIRGSSSNSLSTRKYIGDIQIKSEQCDDEILNGLPTTDYFEINGNSYFVECLYGNNDKCQVYKQYTHTFNLVNLTRNNQTNRRRLQATRIQCPIRIVFQYNSKTWQCSPTGDSLSYGVLESFTTTIDMWYDSEFDDADSVQAGIEIRLKINDNPQYITVVDPNRRRRLQVTKPKPGDSDWDTCAEKYMLCQSPSPTPTPTPSPPTCFPAGSIVNTTTGSEFIENLNIGDKVLSVNSYTGELEYSDIYMYGRKIKEVEADFITLYTDNSELEISASGDHFLYVGDNVTKSGNDNFNGAILKRFKNVIVGKDYIFDARMNKYLVIKKDNKKMNGLYSPYTLNGNIIVNGIISSCYSHSIFDHLLISENQYDSYLPGIYQMCFAPLRWIYSSNPLAWKLFNSLYPDGISGVYDMNIFDFGEQVYWALFIQES